MATGRADRELVDRELIATKADYARSFKWGFDHFTDNPQDDWRCDAISARAWRRELSDEDDEMAYEDILDDIGPCQCASCAGANYRAARGPNAQLPLSIRIALNLAFIEPRQIRYYDDYCELREGELIERNGSLAYIRDAETGEQGWVPTFYIEGGLRDG